MNFKYKWKNGSPPSRDQAARSQHLLDESQFETEDDRHLAEQEARRYLNVPLHTSDHDRSVLPHAAPSQQNKTLM